MSLLSLQRSSCSRSAGIAGHRRQPFTQAAAHGTVEYQARRCQPLAASVTANTTACKLYSTEIRSHCQSSRLLANGTRGCAHGLPATASSASCSAGCHHRPCRHPYPYGLRSPAGSSSGSKAAAWPSSWPLCGGPDCSSARLPWA